MTALFAMVRAPPLAAIAPPLSDTWLPPSAPLFPMANVPADTVVAPVYVFAPLNVHVPDPDLVTAVVFAPPLSTIFPAISPVPAAEPCNVRVLLPTPVAVRSLVNFRRPAPD